MKVLLVGYGKMGQAIEKIAVARGHEIVGRVDIQTNDKIAPGADVAIEFTQPGAAVSNITKCLSAGIPVVSGTTGWLEKLDEVKAACKQHNGAFFYASNYSLGVNIFFKVNEYLSKLMSGQEAYDVTIDENTSHAEERRSQRYCYHPCRGRS